MSPTAVRGEPSVVGGAATGGGAADTPPPFRPAQEVPTSLVGRKDQQQQLQQPKGQPLPHLHLIAMSAGVTASNCILIVTICD